RMWCSNDKIKRPKATLSGLADFNRSLNYIPSKCSICTRQSRRHLLHEKKAAPTRRKISSNDTNEQDAENAENPNDALRLAFENSTLKRPMFEAFCHRLCIVQQAGFYRYTGIILILPGRKEPTSFCLQQFDLAEKTKPQFETF